MDIKPHFNSHKLTLAKVTKKSQFCQEDLTTTDASLPLSSNRPEFQTDDSETPTPSSLNKIKASGFIIKKSSKSKFQLQLTSKGDSKSSISQNGLKMAKHRTYFLSDQEVHTTRESKVSKLEQHPFRHLIFGPHTSQDILQKHLSITQRGLQYATKCLKGPSLSFIRQKEVEMPILDLKKKILVLDLDETLIHWCQGKESAQVTIPINDDQHIAVNIRPYVSYFLDTLSTFYSIFVFTASSPLYATTIIDYIDPTQNQILGIMSRGHCMETKNGFFIKDLRIMRGVNLKDVVIIDNLSHSFGLQIDNGIPILEWQNDPRDQELKYLADYLIEASTHYDLREFNKSKLRLGQLIQFNLNEYVI